MSAASPILLLGAQGQLGWQLQRDLAPLGPLLAVDRRRCDLGNLDQVRSLVREVKPRLIVNAAAYTAVDQAEQEPDLARRINAEAVGLLAEEAKALDALLVHYSTDYVFDGSKTAPYGEGDLTHPLSVYGRTKREGEEAIAAVAGRALIFRTSWVFGARGKNFVKTILRLASERDSLKVVADQIGSPTPAAMIATVTGMVLAQLGGGREQQGCDTYHLAAANPVSWNGFARAIVATAQATPGFALKLGPAAIAPIPSSDYPLPAPRPLNSRLDCR
ncbi:MAG TPA: dTDP-4-dehydrorhamnose reductase, partial [Azospira sp.]|nr:dTDP-4-dehydrorhamnose reductase [Azospira sp.]